MIRLLVRLIITALALNVAVVLVPGIHWNGDYAALLGVAVVFTLVNALLKPLLTLLSCPLILLTLGLFLLVVNALLLLITAHFSQQLGLGFVIDGFWPACIGGIIVGLASAALTGLTGSDQPRRSARQ